MVDLRLPRTARYPALLELLEDATNDDPRVRVLVPGRFFVDPDGLAILVAWLLREKRRGREIEIGETEASLHYLARMDFFKALGIPFEESFRRHASGGRFVPIKLIQPAQGIGDGAMESVNAVCDMVLRAFEDGALFLAALEWATMEIVDNIQWHANAESPGVLCAQYFPAWELLEIAIFDLGRGILSSLGATHPELEDSTSAIRLAVQQGVTDGLGNGNGLAGARDVLRANRGELQIWSVDSSVRFAPQSTIGTRATTASFPGTGVVLSFRPDRPVATEQLPTVGHRDWYYVHAELRRLSSDGVRIRDECDGVVRAAAARGLRRKLCAILADDVWNEVEPATPVSLDFSDGGETPSSEFLAELLGRLVEKTGAHVHERVRLVGLSRRGRERSAASW